MKDKKAETIINVMMNSLVATFGRPGKCWSNVEGEFNIHDVRQMGEAIGCKMQTGAGHSAWMNGLNKKEQCRGGQVLSYDTPR